jgi:hypothetical protein
MGDAKSRRESVGQSMVPRLDARPSHPVPPSAVLWHCSQPPQVTRRRFQPFGWTRSLPSAGLDAPGGHKGPSSRRRDMHVSPHVSVFGPSFFFAHSLFLRIELNPCYWAMLGWAQQLPNPLDQSTGLSLVRFAGSLSPTTFALRPGNVPASPSPRGKLRAEFAGLPGRTRVIPSLRSSRELWPRSSRGLLLSGREQFCIQEAPLGATETLEHARRRAKRRAGLERAEVLRPTWTQKRRRKAANLELAPNPRRSGAPRRGQWALPLSVAARPSHSAACGGGLVADAWLATRCGLSLAPWLCPLSPLFVPTGSPASP